MPPLARYHNMAVIISRSSTGYKQNKSSPWQHTTRHEMNAEGSLWERYSVESDAIRRQYVKIRNNKRKSSCKENAAKKTAA